jgi:hypothetical protein
LILNFFFVVCFFFFGLNEGTLGAFETGNLCKRYYDERGF